MRLLAGLFVPSCACFKTLSDSSSTKELSTRPSKGTFGRAFSGLLKEAFPLVQTKRGYLLSKPPCPLLPWIPRWLKFWKPYSQNYPSWFMPLSKSPHVPDWILRFRFVSLPWSLPLGNVMKCKQGILFSNKYPSIIPWVYDPSCFFSSCLSIPMSEWRYLPTPQCLFLSRWLDGAPLWRTWVCPQTLRVMSLNLTLSPDNLPGSCQLRGLALLVEEFIRLNPAADQTRGPRVNLNMSISCKRARI